jgi:hypothetical protein
MIMQRLDTRKDRTTARKKRVEDKPQVSYYLRSCLPDGHILAFHAGLGTLSYLTVEGKEPRMVTQEQFNTSESSLLLPLLENYPHYCPYEIMFANFYNGSVSENTVARARQRLQEAQDYGTWDHEMRPVRNVLSRARLKLKSFGIDVLSILETGYMLDVIRKADPTD